MQAFIFKVSESYHSPTLEVYYKALLVTLLESTRRAPNAP